MERESRSGKYQYMILEVLCSELVWNSFANEDSINHFLNPWRYDERLANLQDELKVEFWIVAKQVCTERQWECLSMYAQGYTQTEIAKILNVNQSSITKSINGNVDYKNGETKVYGGVIKKLRKAIKDNQKIQLILLQIQELQEEKL
jgi:predicted DNA-binding protein YlxM (UPF0122 family)